MLKPVSNPPNPYSKLDLEWIDAAPDAALTIYEEEAKSIITRNSSPDIPFSFSVNPYRGCFHGCAYCYARPTHQYLDFGAGSDFERKIVAKVNAPSLLRAEFMKRSWKGEPLTFSGITDCYQPLEASYRLTRGCLEVCRDFSNPVSIVTKGALIRRDLDLLREIHERSSLQVYMSIAFADDDLSKKLEPGAPRPSTRFRAMRELTAAGISVGVGLAPVIPGLNDREIPSILELAKEAGASSAFMTLVRLPKEVKPVFLERLNEEFPSRAKKVVSQIGAMKDGTLNRSQFGTRMVGNGPQWDAVEFLFNRTVERLGLRAGAHEPEGPRRSTFRRPGEQLTLL